ncbi:MAG: hypothetical protein J6V99_04495 [Neisseriaceae bacterium]|nr:hypothetical protein [Neisseriaceae bacterium]
MMTEEQNELPEWKRHLMELHRNKQSSEENSESVENASSEEKASLIWTENPEERQKAYQAYLNHWQKEHNIHVEDTAPTHILFADEWQHESEGVLSQTEENHQNTVWLKLNVNSVEQNLSSSNQPESESMDLFASEIEEEVQTIEQTPIQIQVVEPPVDASLRVALMNEQTLQEHLYTQLRPHIDDAVTGVVKTAINRHLEKMVRELQEEIPAELDSVIHDVLQLHLQKALSEIKKQAGIQSS